MPARTWADLHSSDEDSPARTMSPTNWSGGAGTPQPQHPMERPLPQPGPDREGPVGVQPQHLAAWPFEAARPAAGRGLLGDTPDTLGFSTVPAPPPLLRPSADQQWTAASGQPPEGPGRTAPWAWAAPAVE